MKDFIRELFRALAVGTAIYAVFLAIYFFLGRPLSLNRELGIDFLEHLLFSGMLYMANAYVFLFAFRYFGNRFFTWKALLMCLAANVLVSVVAIFMANALLKVVLGAMSFDEFLAFQSVSYYAVTVLIALVVSVIFYLVYYYKSRQEDRVQEQRIIAGTASAQFDALKNQLDPHFLFNSLNVLNSLIEEDPHQAQRFTTSLSKVYRYVLEQKNKELIPIAEEFAFARIYVDLLRMRFEDSIEFHLPEVTENPEGLLVPLSLQLLLENAVKHNAATPEAPLVIEIRERQGVVEVINRLQERPRLSASSGVGLQNIVRRYALLSDRKVQILKSEAEFRVELPVLTRQVSGLRRQEVYIKDKRYQKAREKLEAIKGFYGNLSAYLIVIPLLIWINYRTTSFPWAIFPSLGWGFGVLMHGLEAYGINPLWGKRWEERKIKELMERKDF